jgi:serine protease Do
MNDAPRRIIIVGLILGISLAALYLVRPGDKGFGLFDLLSGKSPTRREKETYTLEPKSRVDLSAVEVLSRLSEESALLAAAVTPSVVSITTTNEVDVPTLTRTVFGTRLSNRRVIQPGLGSGVIVTAEGHIITNYHVIHQARQIEVTLKDNRKLPATIVGVNSLVDIAVLKLAKTNGETFPALRFADSNEVRQGEYVFAIGAPFGLSETVTRGIICAKERRFNDSEADLFQTDAVINPGNSGGPLVNVRGDVVGINVAIFSGEKNTGLWQGVGLAIASNDVRDSFEAILNEGKPVYGYLGVRVLRSQSPVTVESVEPGSPADGAGLRSGDILLEFEGEKLHSFDDLKALVRRIPGKDLKLRVEREGQEIDVTARIVPYDEEAAAARAIAIERPAGGEEAASYLSKSLGIEVRELTADEKLKIGAGANEGGVLVTKVAPGTPADGEIAPGDLIHHCNGMSFGSAEQFTRLLDARAPNEQVYLLVSRKVQGFNAWHNSFVILNPWPVEKP